MKNTGSLPAVLTGLFISGTILIDWFWNTPFRGHSLSEEELYRYKMFLESPRRVLAPPDLVSEWWMVMLSAGSIFFCGFIAARVTMDIYKSRFITLDTIYLKAIATFGLLMGSCAGYLLLISAYMFPLVWKIYFAVGVTLLTFFGFYLVLRAPFHLYVWWKQKRTRI